MLQTTLEKNKKWTYHDYLQLDEDIIFEIIEGEQQMAAAPNWQHQNISQNLERLLDFYVQQKKLGKIFHAPVDVVLDENNVIQPDIIFISQANLKILRKEHPGIIGVPDLVVEIVSPSSFHRDVHQKKDLYEHFQVREYWIIEPATATVEVFVLENGKYQLLAFAAEKGVVTSKVLEGFQINIAEIMHV